MQFGIWTPLPHTVMHEPRMVQAVSQLRSQGTGRDQVDPSLQFIHDVVRAADGYGFDVTLIAERHQGPDLSSWMLAGSLASVTKNIRLMVATHPGILSPQIVAKFGASLDRISGGRFCINVVNGWWREEMNFFGNGAWIDDAGERADRMSEFVDVIKGLWTNETFSYDGRYFKFEDESVECRPVHEAGPEIFAAGRSPASRAIVSQKCDVWFAEYREHYSAYHRNVENLRSEIAEMRAEAAKHGRTLKIGISAHVICDKTVEAANQRAAELEAYGKKDKVAAIAANALGPGLIGTPQMIAERLAEYNAAGVDLVMVKFSPMEQDLVIFGEEVMPQFKSHQ